MKKLTVRKTLEYLSPTSIMQAMECEFEFYLLRLSGIEGIKLPQNRQMAVGCAFDSFVKSRISEILGKEVFLAKLLETVEEQNKDCIPIGHRVFEHYNSYGFVDKLIKEGAEDIELEFKKEIGGKVTPGTETSLGGIKLFGKPDSRIKNNPHDWKTSGFESQYQISPKQGYCECIKIGYPQGAHLLEKMSMEEVDKRWAIQLTIYYWLMNGLVIEEIPGAIDQIIIPPNYEDGVIVAKFRNIISKKFVQELWEKVKDLWERLKEGIVQEPQCSSGLCEPFNNPKPCTVFCPFYSRWLKNPMEQMVRKK